MFIRSFRATIGCVVVVVVGACTLANDFFQATSVTATATTTTGESTTQSESDGSTATSTSGTASTSASTSDATTSEGTSLGTDTTSTTTDATSTTDTGVDTDTDTTTGEPNGCWDKPLDGWTIETFDLDAFGLNPSAPRLSPDGLTLHFMAGMADARALYQVTRAAVGQPYGGVKLVAKWTDGALDHPTITNGGQELFLSAYDTDIWRSTNNGGVWSPFTTVPSLQTGLRERSPQAILDGSRIFFERNDGPQHPYFQDGAFRLHEAARPANPPPGTPFMSDAPVVISGLTDDPNYPHLMFCATPSADGLHLFFASTYPIILDELSVKDALTIYYTRRESLDGPWESAIQVTQFTKGGVETCADSVSVDGCEFYFHHWDYDSLVSVLRRATR